MRKCSRVPPLIKNVIIGIITTSIVLVGISLYSDYATKQSYADYMEDAQRGFTIGIEDWGTNIKGIMSGQRTEPVVLAYTDTIDALPGDKFLVNGLSDIGRRSLLPLAVYITHFGKNDLAESPVDERLSYLMVYYDLLLDAHELWTMEILYNRGTITDEEYLFGINQRRYLNITDIDEVVLEGDGDIGGLDRVEWMHAHGWEQWDHDYRIPLHTPGSGN